MRGNEVVGKTCPGHRNVVEAERFVGGFGFLLGEILAEDRIGRDDVFPRHVEDPLGFSCFGGLGCPGVDVELHRGETLALEVGQDDHVKGEAL